jgi:hypothetical protein
MSDNQHYSETGAKATADTFSSFDAAFIGGSLAVGAMLFVMLLTIKDLFPTVQ